MKLKDRKISKETERWLKETEADLKPAKDSLIDRNYNWSCFQSQQSVENALKAYLYNYGYRALLTHSIKILLRRIKNLKNFLSWQRPLDMYYIFIRYPNGIDPETVPSEYFDEEDVKKCLNYATLILKTVKELLKR